MFCKDYKEVYVTYSDDDGETFSDIKHILTDAGNHAATGKLFSTYVVLSVCTCTVCRSRRRNSIGVGQAVGAHHIAELSCALQR